MSQKIGKLLTCDRCGATEFLPYTGTSKSDGGFTHTDHFSKPTEPWLIAEDLGDCVTGHQYIELCPTCRKSYLQTKHNFLYKKRVDIFDQA